MPALPLRAALAAALLAAATTVAAAQPAPDTLRTPGLRAPVTLLRDSAGIVHIRAANEHDLFFAQGWSAAATVVAAASSAAARAARRGRAGMARKMPRGHTPREPRR